MEGVTHTPHYTLALARKLYCDWLQPILAAKKTKVLQQESAGLTAALTVARAETTEAIAHMSHI